MAHFKIKAAAKADLKRIAKFTEQTWAGKPVGSHIIFYKIGDGDLVEIIRVLHKRMDVFSRLFKA